MFKITFLGAGSTVFAKNVLGDCILTPELGEFEIALYDIDEQRLNDSYKMLININKNYSGKANINMYLDRKEALKNSKYIVNAIQVGGYEPCTVTDFEIPKKYNLRQTIGDTLGVAGIFRALRTIYVLEDIAKDIKEVCPNALFINYSNPMAILTGYLEKYLGIRTIGLCHSVQYCVKGLLETFKMEEYLDKCDWTIYGINHQAWLLELKDNDGNDLYKIIKEKNLENTDKYNKNWDLVRLEILKKFGYYVTESSEHTAEYTPWFIKERYPELIKEFNIPLDEYPRRCIKQINDWIEMRKNIVDAQVIEHKKSFEFASYIIKAIETKTTYRVHGNVMNTLGLIPNLPKEACVEVPCLIDQNGINPCAQKPLPEICAAINRTNINVQILTMQAAFERRKELVYQAAYMDPHTAAELSLEDIKSLCDDLFDAHKDWLPEYK